MTSILILLAHAFPLSVFKKSNQRYGSSSTVCIMPSIAVGSFCRRIWSESAWNVPIYAVVEPISFSKRSRIVSAPERLKVVRTTSSALMPKCVIVCAIFAVIVVVLPEPAEAKTRKC